MWATQGATAPDTINRCVLRPRAVRMREVGLSNKKKQSSGGFNAAKHVAIEPQQAFQQALERYGARDWRGAESLCRRNLKALPDHIDTLHLLGALLLQSERFDEALPLLEHAQRLQPRNPAIANKLGIVCMHLKRADEALDQFAAALAVDSSLVEVYAARGALYETMGQLEAAVSDFTKAIELRPDFVLGHLLLGNRLAAMGQTSRAVDCYDNALKLAPDFADALHARGNALRDLGQFDQALQSYEQALRFAPNHFAALASLADLLVHQGHQDAALKALDKVIGLKPDHIEALLLRGALRYQRSDLDAAHADFARLVRLEPMRFEPYMNIGSIHLQLGRYPQALANFEEALRLKPDDALIHLNHSMALAATGALDKAFEANAKAMALAPNMAEAICNQGSLLARSRQLEAAVQSYRRACELKPDFVDARSSLLFALVFMAEIPPEQVRAEAQCWNLHHAQPLRTQRFTHTQPNPERLSKRLRLGYVSSDLRHHVVANFMAPILANHDNRAFEVFCYHCYPERDDVSNALARHVEHWVDVASFSSEALAQRIHDDQIDVLVDLAGHSAGNRLLSFARQPAPVQMTYLGYPGTTGVETIGYRITDIYADPPAADAYYTETLLRLPHSLWCYRPAPGMPEVSPLPAISRGHLTFGSFNSFSKIDRRAIELWAKLLQAVPNARLVVATAPEGQSRSAFLAEMAELGIESSRIDLLGKLPSEAFWRELGDVDVSLDPVSVNGATTTCESLWLGVPVLSRVGDRFLERAGFSLLSTAGLSEFACESDEACVELVRGLSADLPRLAALRAGLRTRLRQTPLLDAQAFTRSLENLYREAWGRWAAGSPSAPE